MRAYSFDANGYRALTETLVDGILGLSAPSMVQYIKFVTNRLLVALNVSKIYNTENPFEFVDMMLNLEA